VDQSNIDLQRQIPSSSKVISRDAYESVLDLIFPKDISEPDKTYFSIIIRIKPSFDIERQIIIRKTVGKYSVLLYEAVDGNIYRKLNHIINDRQITNPEELAKFLKVSKRTVSLPHKQVENWHAAFLNALSRSLDKLQYDLEELEKQGTVTVLLDGTTYELWYEQGMNKIAFSVYDAELTKSEVTGILPLVRWMNTVRLEVEHNSK
jgi:hypothetical protein